jgi:hypothetical protein
MDRTSRPDPVPGPHGHLRMTTASTVDLASVSTWEHVTLPHTTAPVALARLRISARQGLSAAVWYPAGWEFRASGAYAADLDAVIVEGSLTIGGSTLRAGEHAFLEAGYFWSGARTVTGALVFQRFSEAPRWIDSDRPLTRIGQRATFLPSVTFTATTDARVLRRHRGTTVRLVAHLAPGTPADADTELFDVKQRRWSYVPAGSPLPEGERLVVITPAS